MAVDEAVRLEERNRRQGIAVDGGKEIGRILDVRGALGGVRHDGGAVRLEVADVAVGSAYEFERVRRLWIMLQGHRRVVCTAVVSPRNVLLVQRFTNGANVGWGNRVAASDPS